MIAKLLEPRNGNLWLLVISQELCQIASRLLIGCMRVNNQLEARLALWLNSWPWPQLKSFHLRTMITISVCVNLIGAIALVALGSVRDIDIKTYIGRYTFLSSWAGSGFSYRISGRIIWYTFPDMPDNPTFSCRFFLSDAGYPARLYGMLCHICRMIWIFLAGTGYPADNPVLPDIRPNLTFWIHFLSSFFIKCELIKLPPFRISYNFE